MASKKITPEQAAVHVYNVSHSALGVVSNVYKNVLLAGSRYLDEKTDNTLGRLSGMSYMAKTLHAVVGGFKDVETQKLKEILQDGKMNFKEKAKESVKHVHHKFSHEATVAAGMYLGKGAVVVAPIVLGVTALVALAAPAAAATAGLIAGGVAMKAATYYLSTHAGHKLESTMAEKVKAGMHFLTGFRKAAKGQDPEMNHMHEIGEKMEHAGKEHGHKHGHGHHHSFKDTFKQDITAVARVDKWPKEVAKFVTGIAKDCVGLWNRVSGQAPVTVQTVEAKAPTSKFMQPDPSKTISYVAPEPKNAGNTYVVTGTDIKAAVEKENKVTQSPPKQKPPSMKM